MGVTVTDAMLALHLGHDFKSISIGEFSLRLAEELADTKLDGRIVRPTKEMRVSVDSPVCIHPLPSLF